MHRARPRLPQEQLWPDIWLCHTTLTFFRGHGDKRSEELLHVRSLTMWALDVLRAALFEALMDDKRPIAILTLVFIRGHDHTLQS